MMNEPVDLDERLSHIDAAWSLDAGGPLTAAYDDSML